MNITKTHKFRIVFWLGMIILIIGCTTNDVPTATVPSVAEVFITRATSTVTSVPTIPATQILPTLTLTPLPTTTTEPTQTQPPTRTPTPSPWLIEDLSPFLVYNEGANLVLIWPNGEKRPISRGWLLQGQPWSPDGQYFIFEEDPDSLYNSASIANLSTGEVQLLFPNIYGGVHWSPDGNYILFSTLNNSNTVELTLYDFGQQTTEVLLEIALDNGAIVFTYGWSSDSRQIAFVANLNGQYDLYTLDIETRTQHQITASSEVEVLAAWSPVDNQLVVITSPWEWIESATFYGEMLQIIDDTGSEILSLGLFDEITTASWSPNGQKIAYAANDQLCILTVAETSSNCPTENTILLDYATATEFPAAWSPDGNWLAFQSIELDAPQCYKLFLFDLTTNMLVDPDSPTCSFSNLYWSRVVQ